MKPLTLLFILFSMTALAQKDTAKSEFYIRYMIKDSAKEVLRKTYDGRIIITGDTVKAINILFDELERAMKRDSVNREFKYKVIDYLNDKNSKSWRALEAELRRQGYKITRTGQ